MGVAVAIVGEVLVAYGVVAEKLVISRVEELTVYLEGFVEGVHCVQINWDAGRGLVE